MAALVMWYSSWAIGRKEFTGAECESWLSCPAGLIHSAFLSRKFQQIVERLFNQLHECVNFRTSITFGVDFDWFAHLERQQYPPLPLATRSVVRSLAPEAAG